MCAHPFKSSVQLSLWRWLVSNTVSNFFLTRLKSFPYFIFLLLNIRRRQRNVKGFINKELRLRFYKGCGVSLSENLSRSNQANTLHYSRELIYPVNFLGVMYQDKKNIYLAFAIYKMVCKLVRCTKPNNRLQCWYLIIVMPKYKYWVCYT